MNVQKAILEPGDTIGSYIVDSILGKGGFGVTYLAVRASRQLDDLVPEDLRVRLFVDGKEVRDESASGPPDQFAIKEYFPSNLCNRSGSSLQPIADQDAGAFEEGKRKFLVEAKFVMSLRQPNIVECIDAFEDNNTAYLVMPYFPGETLSETIRHRVKLPAEQALQIFRQIGSALEYIHDRQLFHRDIKPSNVYHCLEDDQYLLLDFGAARQRIGRVSNNFSSVLTEGYSPFEQYTRNSKQDRRTDYYAFAATLYHAITGTKPPPSADRKVNDTLIPLRQLAPEEYPAEFLALLDSMMAVDQAQRPLRVNFELAGQSRSQTASANRKGIWIAAAAVIVAIVGALAFVSL